MKLKACCRIERNDKEVLQLGTIDIIIPVYKPEKSFFTLIERLENQTVPVNRILLLNTEQKYFERLIYGTSFLEKYRNVYVRHLSKLEFNHGGTRKKGVQKSDAPVFVMMTQDAIPEDEHMLEHLVKPLEDGKVAASYARQLAAEDSSEIERYMRLFNYPEESRVKSKADLSSLGIKTYFCSNVCAAYNRKIYEELGGFIKHTIFNEDMIYAAAAIQAGYRIVYAAEAKVIHSHNYTFSQQFRRNFDLGVSQADHPEVFAGISSEGEGVQMLKDISAHLWKSGKKRMIPKLYIEGACRYAGYTLGKHYKGLSQKMVLKCTMNKTYWEQTGRIRSSEGIDATKGYGKSEDEG